MTFDSNHAPNPADLPSESTSISTDSLVLSLVPGVGPRIRNILIECFETPTRILNASPSELRSVPGVGPKLSREIALAREQIDPEQTLALCREHDITILDQESPAYPPALNRIDDPPAILFVKGELLPRDTVAIAVVGTRHGTQYGLRQAERLAGGIAQAGYTVVSGLARGIDAAAHRATLAADGRTIAVLGSGLLNLYPPEHSRLFEDIQQQGAVISEFPPMSPPKSTSFPQRNRIVSGLSLGVVVVEAAARSGALISARLAMEQNREVFAVPGPVDSRNSRGCHQLIRDGAKLVENVDDILEEFGPLAEAIPCAQTGEIRHPAELQLNTQEKSVLNAIDAESTLIDNIVHDTGLSVQRVLSTVSVLEMRRLVRRLSGSTVCRV